MSVALDIASWICLLLGGGFCIISTIGLNRMPDFFTRVHAAGITDTVGAGFVLLGLMLQAGLTLITIKLAFIALLIIFNGPVATHALAKAALAHGLKPLLHQEDPPSNLS